MERSKLVDLYNEDVFDQVLDSPAAAEELLRFAQNQHCAENLEFLQKLVEYNRLVKDMKAVLGSLAQQHLSDTAIDQINISDTVMKRTQSAITRTLDILIPQLSSVFVESQKEVRQQIFLDIYPRFVRHQLSLVTTQALYQGMGSYQGLGDCFVISDSRQGDEPIVCTSDRFIELTGYSRPEITSRNCRLLQGQGTDQDVVRRLRTCIDNGVEVVEVLLNFRKNGQPFWNLLYIAPLKGRDGQVEYHLGGQINISSVVNNTSDLFQILSLSNSTDVAEMMAADVAEHVNGSGTNSPHSSLHRSNTLPPKRGKSLFSSLRERENGFGHGNHHQKDQDNSLEDILLKKMQRKSIEKQMEIFSAAYSKYIVIGASDMKVMFYASTLACALATSGGPGTSPDESSFSKLFSHSSKRTPLTPNPLDPDNCKHDAGHERVYIGWDIFKFLQKLTYASDDDVRDLKKTVKSHLKKGHAASASLDSVVDPSSMTYCNVHPNGSSSTLPISFMGENGMLEKESLLPNGARFGRTSGSISFPSGASHQHTGSTGSANSGTGKVRGGPELMLRNVTTHWTPLKDVRGAVSFVVVIIGED